MRAQIDTAVGMILTITIVAAVLILAVWGIMVLMDIMRPAPYDAVYDSLTRAGASYASFGSRHALRIAAPEPFCVFNTTASAVCEPGIGGHEVCASSGLESYWDLAGEEDGNVVFRSGENRKVDFIAPKNGAFACFRAGSQIVFIEGQGRYATVSPLREITVVRLVNMTDTPTTVLRASFFTSSLINDDPELFYVWGVGDPSVSYNRSSVTLGSVTFDDILVTTGPAGEPLSITFDPPMPLVEMPQIP